MSGDNSTTQTATNEPYKAAKPLLDKGMGDALKQYNNGRGAFEFALINDGFYNEYNGDRRQSFCPTF